jgi:hypothetical protein
MMADGWSPNSGQLGGNCGQTRYLYLTNFPENALWFAEQKGENTILAIQVLEGELIVDPEDGTHETVQEELSEKGGFPGSLALVTAIEANRFSLFQEFKLSIF